MLNLCVQDVIRWNVNEERTTNQAPTDTHEQTKNSDFMSLRATARRLPRRSNHRKCTATQHIRIKKKNTKCLHE